MSDILQRILARKREEIDDRRARVSERDLQRRLADAPSVRGFGAALRAKVAAGSQSAWRSR